MHQTEEQSGAGRSTIFSITQLAEKRLTVMNEIHLVLMILPKHTITFP